MMTTTEEMVETLREMSHAQIRAVFRELGHITIPLVYFDWDRLRANVYYMVGPERSWLYV